MKRGRTVPAADLHRLPGPSNVREAEERAVEIAKRLGYELGFWNNRWHYRSVKWNPGVWFAGDFATRLKALDHLVQRMGSGIRERR